MEIYDGGHEKPSLAALQLAMRNVIAGFEHTYILIDALDECVDGEKLLGWIGDILRRNIKTKYLSGS